MQRICQEICHSHFISKQTAKEEPYNGANNLWNVKMIIFSRKYENFVIVYLRKRDFL